MQKKSFNSFISLISVLTLYLTLPICSDEASEWGYAKSTGSDNWSKIKTEYEQCKQGHHQSPVNIKSFVYKKDNNFNIQFNYKSSHEVILNNGHTVELLYDEGSYITFQGSQFRLIQFHFHTPSEHLVKGKHYPLEMHLVHKNIDNSSYLVIAVFFERGKEDKFLNEFIHDVPKKLDKKEFAKNISVVDLLTDIETESSLEKDLLKPKQNQSLTKINISRIIQAKAKFWTYEGSLTTPPCTESVRWVILEDPLTASARQIEKLRQAEGINARHTQKLYEREVEEFINTV